MPIYKDKSHEELRWKDYQLGDKGGPLPSSHSIGQSCFGCQQGGSRDSSYTATAELDDDTSGQTPKLESIPAMPIHKDKNDNIPCKIDEGLYLGSITIAANKNALKNCNITHILTASGRIQPAHPEDFVYKIIDVVDKDYENLKKYFNECSDFIDGAKINGGSVLVHCHAGKSRSVTIVMAYLMKTRGMSTSEAFEHVRRTRRVACPNRGFWSQLMDFEKSLQGGPLPSAQSIGQSSFKGQMCGSRVASYTTTEADSGKSAETAKLESISSMPIYQDKNHEELRWEDYQLGDKGGQIPSVQSTAFEAFGSSATQTNALPLLPPFGQSSAYPFSLTKPKFIPSVPNRSGFGTSAAPAFSSSAFGSSKSAVARSSFGSSQSPFGVVFNTQF